MLKTEKRPGLRIGAAYIRVSTDDQLEYSPESQLDEIKLYAKRNGIVLTDEFIFLENDGISGRKADKRIEFQRMIATAKTKPKPFDVILVWKFSRFARNQDESTFYKGTLRKKLEIDIISVSEPIMEGMYGRLIEMIIEWQDEFYSYNLGMEVTRGMKKKAEKGLYNGAMPLGYTKKANEMPIIEANEALIVKKIFELYTTGYDKNYVVRYLNNIGAKTKRGRQFDNECVTYVLGNPFYIGKIRWNRRMSSGSSALKDEGEWIITDSHHEPLIDIDTWNLAQNKTKNILATREKYAHPVSHQKHWLSGIVKCSVCGKSLSFKSGGSTRSNTFQCLGYRRGLHNESQSISEQKLIAAVLDSLHKAAESKQERFEVVKTNTDFEASELDILNYELESITMKELRIKQAYIDGIDSIEEYKANKLTLLDKRNEIQKRIGDLESIKIDDSNLGKMFYSNVESVIEILESDAPYEKKSEALRSIIKKILFKKEEKELIFFYYLPV